MRVFEPNRYKANRTCPCGKDNLKGKFATELGYAGQFVGKCFSCDKNFYDDNTTLVDLEKIHIERPIIEICYPTHNDIAETFDSELESGFAQYLVKTFGEKKAIKAVEKYFLGVYNPPHGGSKLPSTIFWQVDEDNNERAGKILSYKEDGHRNKEVFPRWWHRLQGQDCSIKQCFFGEHLIPDYNLPIAVVESAKSAVIMSIINPSFIWISSEGATGLSRDKCSTIKGYEVVLFPDAGWYKDNPEKNTKGWLSVADEYGFDISQECEIWQEMGLINRGDDIIDYYVKCFPDDLKTTLPKVKKNDYQWSQKEYDLIFKNNGYE